MSKHGINICYECKTDQQIVRNDNKPRSAAKNYNANRKIPDKKNRTHIYSTTTIYKVQTIYTRITTNKPIEKYTDNRTRKSPEFVTIQNKIPPSRERV